MSLQSELEGLYECVFCSELMVTPVTLRCGHSACGPCWVHWFHTNPQGRVCVTCRTIHRHDMQIDILKQDTILALIQTHDPTRQAEYRNRQAAARMELAQVHAPVDATLLLRRSARAVANDAQRQAMEKYAGNSESAVRQARLYRPLPLPRGYRPRAPYVAPIVANEDDSDSLTSSSDWLFVLVVLIVVGSCCLLLELFLR